MTTFNVSAVVAADTQLPRVDVSEKVKLFKTESQYLHGVSKETPPLLTDGYQHGFLNAAVTAFAQHLPLSLAPDHFWLLVVQAISQHVGVHAEELRSRFVTHSGKEDIVIELPHFRLHEENDWSEPVTMFADEIQKRCKPNVVDASVPQFSTTKDVETMASMMTLMKTTQHYFEYTMVTRCGIPTVTLEGEASDWGTLRQRTETVIRQLCLDKFSTWWLSFLLPILDKLEETARLAGAGSEVDVPFWENFVKRGSVFGSGGGTYISGWINAFFPYTTRGKQNEICMEPGWATTNWSDNFTQVDVGLTLASDRVKGAPLGMRAENFPGSITRVPVKWLYLGDNIPLQFCAGFLGVSQTNLTLRPEVGWMVLDDDDGHKHAQW